MGVDARLHLPARVQLDHVAKALGILLGCPAGWSEGGSYVIVADVKTRGHETIPTMASIDIVAHGERYHFYYHFEGDNGGHTLSSRSYARAIAAYIKIADLFGGVVVPSDGDDKPIYYAREKNILDPHDDPEWSQLQQALYSLKPITREEIDECRKYAAYDVD